MKNKNYSDYGTYNLNKVDAPRKNKKGEPKASKISGGGDLRTGNKK